MEQAVFEYVVWLLVSKLVDEKSKPNPKWDRWWRVGQWITGWLWTTWLQHDLYIETKHCSILTKRTFFIRNIFNRCILCICIRLGIQRGWR